MAQIDYTSRDYEALKEDLTSLISTRTGYSWDSSDPSDLGSVLVEAFAYMGDIMSYYLDRVANETTVDNAVKRETLLNFASLYGYKPSGPTPAQVSVLFTNTGDTNIDIPVGTQVMAPLTYGPYTEVFFETTQAAVQLVPDQTITLLAKEGKTVNTDKPDLIDAVTNKPLPTSLGASNGLVNQSFSLYDVGVVDNSLIVYVGQGVAFSPWAYVPSLTSYGPEALVFTTSQNADGTINILFGDGVNGAVPAANQLISAIYKTSVGISGNIVSNAIQEVTFIPGNGDPESVAQLSATNTVAASGGADADNAAQLKKKIKAAISSRGRATTLSDYDYLTSLVPQVGKSKAVAAVYSNVSVYVQPQDDGSITPGLINSLPTASWSSIASNVSAYLADKIPVGTTVSVLPPEYVRVYLTMDIVIEPAYKQNKVKLDIGKAFLNADGLFGYQNNTFGRSIPQSTVVSKADGIEGVISVTITKLNTTNAVSVASISLQAYQIPYLLPTDLVINVTGGLA
jgi:hypothetical protein